MKNPLASSMLRSRGERTGAQRGRRKGQSLVEFAIGLPFMLLIMLGTLDMGQMFFEYIELRGAVREGASYGARNPYDNLGIESAVWDHSPDLETGTTVDISPVPGDIDVDDDVTITITATREFQPLTTSFLARFGIGPVTMVATASAKVWT